jgi:hypothetical protein
MNTKMNPATRRIFDMGRQMLAAPALDIHLDSVVVQLIPLQDGIPLSAEVLADAEQMVRAMIGQMFGCECANCTFGMAGVEDGTAVETLIGMAKDGEETLFKEYAGLVGVAAAKVDELWTGTRARLEKKG